MTGQRFWRNIFCLFMFLISQSAATPTAEKMLGYGWEPWEPYQYKGENGEVHGLDVELVEAMAIVAGYRINVRAVPWKRHLKDIQAGRIELASGASKSDERKAYAYFSVPYRMETVVLLVRRGEAEDYKFQSLRSIVRTGFRLGAIRSYYYGETFAELKEIPKFQAQLSEVTEEEQNLRKLLNNRLDGMLIDMYTAASLTHRLHVESRIDVHPMTIHVAPVHLMFSKKSCTRTDVEAFNQALAVIKQNGVYEGIMKKYAFADKID